jgi:YbbR domain-containing protein
LEKIRSFLLAKKSREFLIFLFFVFVSFCFWLLQVLNDDYETELSMQLKLKNVPENVVLTSELPNELKIGVQDKGTVLINYLLGKSLYPVTIDFEEYQDKGNQIRFLSSALSKRVTGQLSQSTKLLAIKPDTLELIYTRGEGKKVPVCLRGEVEAERQYYISERIFSPDSVMVYAPREILDTITAAYTETLYVKEISDTTRHRAGIMPVKGARFTPSYSDITFMVDMYSEKTVEVPVQGVNFPEDKLLRTFPSKVQVTFQIGLRQFKTVNAEDFTVVVDYQTLEREKSEKCKPVLLKSPANVNLIRVAPAEIDYIIEQKIMFND